MGDRPGEVEPAGHGAVVVVVSRWHARLSQRRWHVATGAPDAGTLRRVGQVGAESGRRHAALDLPCLGRSGPRQRTTLYPRRRPPCVPQAHQPAMSNPADNSRKDSLFTRRTTVATIALSLVFVGLLHWQGRPVWCKYGFGIWANTWTHCTSQHLLDPYSFTHISHGILFFWLLVPVSKKVALHWRLVIALALEIGWE